jgi:hypothetical protein
MIRLNRLALQLLLSAPAAAQLGVPFCHGDGCPCGNEDAAAGCANAGLDGSPTTGALLAASGSLDVLADDLVLTVSGVTPSQFGLVFMGAAQPSVQLGDGLRCVGAGAQGLWRFDTTQADAAGNLVRTNVVAASQSFAGGAITVGSTWAFQAWYRDPGGPCGTSFNLSSALALTFDAGGAGQPRQAQLAGRPLSAYPWFERVAAVNQGAPLHVALDPPLLGLPVGATLDVFIVAAKSAAEWALDAALIDARGAPQSWTVAAGGVQANTLLGDGGLLNGTLGTGVGVGYDVVLDVDRDGALGAGDVIDGLSDEPGVSVVRDTAAPGPHGVTEVLHNGGSWLGQDIYYPTGIAGLGQLPLVVVSHGNGHNYQWYDHVGNHLASYGYVVMSHQNNTQPGIETASTTTLTNTEHFLANLATIAGGALDGHVDGARIVWLGHSRGGEGITRAYTRLKDGDFVPSTYGAADVRLLSSIAPTTFLGFFSSNPQGVPYHLWVGSADADVTGAPNSGAAQSFPLLERATGMRMATVLQGSGHGVFHDGSGSWVATGPCQNGRIVTHAIMRGYLVPLLAHVLDGDAPSKDFLWRQWEAFAPIGQPLNGACVVVNLEYEDGPLAGNFVIDDFQSEPAVNVSSSGQAVTSDVEALVEERFKDPDGNLAWNSQPFNGFTRVKGVNDQSRGIVFEWQAPAFLEFALDPAEQDLTDDGFLAFRACQGTRHPHTAAVLEDLVFTVTLRDVSGGASSIRIDAYGGGIEEPYQRDGEGVGTGWSNEFETVRLRLSDFQTDGAALDLSQVAAVRFEFGAGAGAAVGRLGLDDLEITRR